MSSSCEKTNLINLGCHPYLTIGCIISCAICTIVMIWWVYAMRVDMARMEKMMTPSNINSNHSMPMDESTIMSSEMMTPSSNNDDAMREHCKMMPDMVGCEKYR